MIGSNAVAAADLDEKEQSLTEINKQLTNPVASRAGPLSADHRGPRAWSCVRERISPAIPSSEGDFTTGALE